ncbi:MAG: NTP transferase domain-containing protein [Candidatus Magasanikbacteria bacterium]|jgi:bifunctional UDP-N-acetylglucosamine pyrophosphorylase / glucosamine-1-phosphate N-acetyltransferase|nr:NTP transferase domain-containing protein [Candidatus Magasanikbacteria bacterium]MBT4072026.1 NTP transferase domain-containing protein [Candidatus Magasanikbacteria bacterium]
MINKNIGVVILAAGKGTRLGCVDIPKVMLDLCGKPVVSYIVETVKKIGFLKEQICLVVGYKQEKVKEYFGESVIYAEQKELLGTAHAAYTGMVTLPEHIDTVLVIQGDDSAFYSVEALDNLLKKHEESGNTLSLLSAVLEDPANLGRVIRHENGDVEVIEKEYTTDDQKQVKEISTGTFIFYRKWFEEMFPNMPELRKLGEYGLPTSLAMVRADKKAYGVYPLEDGNEFLGINTKEQFEEAKKRKGC